MLWVVLLDSRHAGKVGGDAVRLLVHVTARDVAYLHATAEGRRHLLRRHAERQADGAPLVGVDGALHADIHCSVGALQFV